jgi:hypothetical protein
VVERTDAIGELRQDHSSHDVEEEAVIVHE